MREVVCAFEGCERAGSRNNTPVAMQYGTVSGVAMRDESYFDHHLANVTSFMPISFGSYTRACCRNIHRNDACGFKYDLLERSEASISDDEPPARSSVAET